MEGASAPVSVFGPVHPPTTFEETVERLGTAIRLGLLSPFFAPLHPPTPCEEGVGGRGPPPRLGLLPPGPPLPPERELAEQPGIARSTLRQALPTPAQAGPPAPQRGGGGATFAAAAPP